MRAPTLIHRVVGHRRCGLQRIMGLINGVDQCVRALVATPVVDLTHPGSSYGRTPLHAAALHGHDECVQTLHGTPGTDVECVDRAGVNVLVAACSAIMNALGHIGSADTTRVLVRLLTSRQMTVPILRHAISVMQPIAPCDDAEVAAMEVCGEGRDKQQKVVRLLLPVLQAAESLGQRRGCA